MYEWLFDWAYYVFGKYGILVNLFIIVFILFNYNFLIRIIILKSKKGIKIKEEHFYVEDKDDNKIFGIQESLFDRIAFSIIGILCILKGYWILVSILGGFFIGTKFRNRFINTKMTTIECGLSIPILITFMMAMLIFVMLPYSETQYNSLSKQFRIVDLIIMFFIPFLTIIFFGLISPYINKIILKILNN